jgi:hypothetical protein
LGIDVVYISLDTEPAAFEQAVKTYPISNTSLDEKGNFKLTYSKADYGIGYR